MVEKEAKKFDGLQDEEPIKHHAARILVDKKALARLLLFEGGTILSIKEPDEYYRPDHVIIVIELPDLPEVNQGDVLYEYHLTIEGHSLQLPVAEGDSIEGVEGNFIKYTRLVPPVKEVEEAEANVSHL